MSFYAISIGTNLTWQCVTQIIACSNGTFSVIAGCHALSNEVGFCCPSLEKYAFLLFAHLMSDYVNVKTCQRDMRRFDELSI
jgi:hypothetical protein